MVNLPKSYRQDVISALERLLPDSWGGRAAELEEAMFQYSFVDDCIEAYQFKAQDLCFNLRHLAHLAPFNDPVLVGYIDLDDFVRMSNADMVDMCTTTNSQVKEVKHQADDDAKASPKAASPDQRQSRSNEQQKQLVNPEFEPVQLVIARRRVPKSGLSTANQTVEAQLADAFHTRILKELFGAHSESLFKCRTCVPGTIVNWRMKTKRSADEGPNVKCKCTGCGSEWEYRG
jgi:DNA-directed RNA polymerase subunit M/transcription elongation factor TFIIS